jgi:hypothetical protein
MQLERSANHERAIHHDLAALVVRPTSGYSLEAPSTRARRSSIWTWRRSGTKHRLFVAAEPEVPEPGDFVTVEVGPLMSSWVVPGGGQTMCDSGRAAPLRVKRSVLSGVMSTNGVRSRCRSRMTSPMAGACRKPWPEKPVAYRTFWVVVERPMSAPRTSGGEECDHLRDILGRGWIA